MQPESRKYLWDALTAADLVAEFVAGKDFNAYQADPLLRSAVERQLEIMGEALGQMSRRDSETANLIPDLARIVAFRNILIHGYATVDDRVVWGIIATRLASFRSIVREILEGT